MDLVVINHGPDKGYLFQAPTNCEIKKGDHVLCETRYGAQQGKVVSVLHSPRLTTEELEFLFESTGATLPLKKILGIYQAFEYPEDNLEFIF